MQFYSGPFNFAWQTNDEEPVTKWSWKCCSCWLIYINWYFLFLQCRRVSALARFAREPPCPDNLPTGSGRSIVAFPLLLLVAIVVSLDLRYRRRSRMLMSMLWRSSLIDSWPMICCTPQWCDEGWSLYRNFLWWDAVLVVSATSS